MNAHFSRKIRAKSLFYAILNLIVFAPTLTLADTPTKYQIIATSILSPVSKFSLLPKMNSTESQKFGILTKSIFNGTIQVKKTRQSHPASTTKNDNGQIEFFDTDSDNRKTVTISTENNGVVTSSLDLSKGTYDSTNNTYIFNNSEGYYVFAINGDDLKLQSNLLQNGTRYEFDGNLQRSAQ